MNTKFLQRLSNRQHKREKGQSIVLIAFVMVGLLAFVGISVDVGFVFARGSQLQAAVDAAALAAVTEISGDDLDPANVKAGQFLHANRLPTAVVQTMQSSTDSTALKATQYSLTVTWPVDLFFLRVIGQRTVDLTRSATAAYFPLADIYASRRVDEGIVSTSNQAIFGPNICTNFGDPFSPLNSPWEPGFYTYQYRILVPGDYPSGVLRVELFDPDSINQATNIVSIAHTQAAIDRGFPTNEEKNCTDDTEGAQTELQINPCLVQTGELDLTISDPTISIDQINPYWLVRIDENRGTGGPPGNGTCGNPGTYNSAYNTTTLYQLYYYRQNPDGTQVRVDLASYTGQPANDIHQTDLRWVSPGAPLSFDQTVSVPIDPGSAKTFELNLAADLPNILTDPGNGNRYVYMDITSLIGASENGFEIWAGPPDYVGSVPSEVNARNIYVLNNPGSHSSDGATVFGLGRLPMNSNFANPIDVPLIYVGPEYAGESIFIKLFDADSGAEPPITFYFDSIAQEDWSLTFGDATDPEGRCFDGGAGYADECNNAWVEPAYEIVVPGKLENCDYQNPTPEDCTPFYGGRLVAYYKTGFSDSYGWEITTTGLPYLVK